jgi:hypothetical protein
MESIAKLHDANEVGSTTFIKRTNAGRTKSSATATSRSRTPGAILQERTATRSTFCKTQNRITRDGSPVWSNTWALPTRRSQLGLCYEGKMMSTERRVYRSQVSRGRSKQYSAIAAMILVGCITSVVVGCSSTREDAEKTEPTPQHRPLVASMEALAKPLPQGEAVPWEAALTLAELSNFAYQSVEISLLTLGGPGPGWSG